MSAPRLQLEGVTRRFGGLVAVDGVSLALAPGEAVALLGPNGCGKTTLLNLVSGALPCSAGRIRLDGEAVEREPTHRIARRGVARTFQLVRVLPSLSCADNVAVGLAFRPGGIHGAAARMEADGLLSRVGLEAAAETPAGELTYIDQKRLEMARALALRPKLLLLDEWMAGLNPTELHTAIELVRALHRDGMTVLLVEHVMAAVRAVCERCIVMSAGAKIADGPTCDVLAAPEVIAAYLGGEADEGDAADPCGPAQPAGAPSPRVTDQERIRA